MSDRSPLRRRARSRRDVGRFVFIGLYLVFLLTPLYWVAITSIKPVDDYMAIPPVWFPNHPTLAHFTGALLTYRGLQGFWNSVIIASCTTVLSTLFGTMMAYSFARFRTGGEHLAFWVLSQRFLPPVAIILPLFLLYRVLHLNDTYIGLILAYTVFTLPLSVWMMYAYFRQMPSSMEEAALVDGCTRWQALWSVAIPLAAPGIVAAAVFVFISCWTEFFFAVILSSRNAFTLPTVFRGFVGFQGSLYGEFERLVRGLAGAFDRPRDARAEILGARPDARRRARIGGANRPWLQSR